MAGRDNRAMSEFSNSEQPEQVTRHSDSGLGSESAPTSKSAEEVPVRRRGILEDLEALSLSSSRGRGRASLMQHLVSTNTATTEPKRQVAGGRGRLLMHLKTMQEQQEIEAPSSSNNSVTTKEDVSEATELEYYKPSASSGIEGSHVNLSCNYLRLNCDPTKGVFVYEVRFNPNVDSIKVRSKYINDYFKGTRIFDGVALYLPILLENKVTKYVTKNSADNSDIEVVITYKRKDSLKNCIHLYNVLFDKVMKSLNMVRFNRSQFDPTAPKIIPHLKLEVWPGFVTAVDEYDGGLMLCCDVSHRVLNQKSAYEFISETLNADEQKYQENMKLALRGSVIITRYNNRTYRIDDIDFEMSPRSTFSTRDGEITYVEYYRKQHNINIRDQNQPLLISKKTRKAVKEGMPDDVLIFCLIPELCYLTGLRDEHRADYKIMRELATFTRVTPNQRLLALEKFSKNVNNSPEASKILGEWGLKLDRTVERMEGRQLGEERIYFANKNFSAGIKGDFSKFAGSNQLLEVVHLEDWLLLYCKMNSNVAKSFDEHLSRVSNALGLRVRKPRTVMLQNDRSDTYANALRSNITKDTQIVVCICPNQRDDRYSTIKRLCCAEIPKPSQVINAFTLSKEQKNRSIVTKIALQMNCKLGGTLWAVQIPFKNVMVCGFDVYHDASNKGNSVAAFIASRDSTFTKWYSKAIVQNKSEELVNGLCASLIASLTAYKEDNGGLPESIIFYRDGVSDGQLQHCLSHEVPQIDRACEQHFRDHSIKITFIVVQKRINTRVFLNRGSEVVNPEPGTIVDHTVTRRKMYDFYLISQSVREGTVSPTHYIVLRDDANYKTDILQRLTYKLCFLYYNWPGTIRIPACCLYAHKLASLIGQSVKRMPSENLAKKLYYL